MAHARKVRRSIETPDRSRCVDIFERPDGTFGFEEYRRDSEDLRGWFPIAHCADIVYPTERAACDAALAHAPWLKDAPQAG